MVHQVTQVHQVKVQDLDLQVLVALQVLLVLQVITDKVAIQLLVVHQVLLVQLVLQEFLELVVKALTQEVQVAQVAPVLQVI